MSEYIKLDPQLKKKWVEALRSGKYSQGLDRLHWPENGSFCCLGVLGHVAGLAPDQMDGGTLDSVCGVVSEPLLAFLKADVFRMVQKELENMNDGVGRRVHSFTEIAAWVEENL